MMPMPFENVKKLKPLKPLPIRFDEGPHTYVWEPTGQQLSYSVTHILGVLKTAEQKRRIDETKHIWGPRGTAVHWCLEQFLNGTATIDQMVAKYPKYSGYIGELLTHPFWELFVPIATEYRVCDVGRSIGGSLDFLGWYKPTESLVLGDLKTLGKRRGPYNTDAQLGGYLSMLIDHMALPVDHCLTFWSKADDCDHGEPQKPQDCLDAWEHTYGLWSATQEEL